MILGKRVSAEAQARLVSGQAALIDGNLDLALYEYTSALKLNPSLPGAHKALGEIALANGKANDAVQHFEAELKIDPNDVQSHIALGCLYALGVVPPDDPHAMRLYLIRRFAEIFPTLWSNDLVMTPASDIDPLTSSIYNFQFAVEHDPANSMPKIGLAIAHLANYDLTGARDKLLSLSIDLANNESIDQTQLLLVQNIIDDINQEEQYLALNSQSPMVPFDRGMPQSTTMPEFNPEMYSTNQPDLSGDLSSLPPLPSLPTSGLPPVADNGAGAGFGNRYQANTGIPPMTADLGMRLSEQDVTPQPTVKPISQDIHLEESNEWVHTVRLANMYQQGSVGFRQGETVVMPNTNVEVKVIESSDDKIVLEENGVQFTWIPGEIGWKLENAPAGPNLDITANSPGSTSGDSGGTTGSNGSGSSGGSGSTENPTGLGPEVPGDGN
jgi:hypothetical protein